MKKVVLALAFVVVLISCGSNTNTGSTTNVDTTKKVVDTVKVDTTLNPSQSGGGKLNQPLK